ncbi:MAG: chloride channel protein, partial [Gammaproteobacteria bacterium]|nr:chloride channel protein [Gammaproteobacteria bacterium]
MFHNRVDRPLLFAVLLLAAGGLLLLFSASGGDWELVAKQGLRLAIGLVLMIALALTPPRYFRLAAPVFYLVVLLLLVLRCVATATSVAGGGAGGLFIPLVVAGALLGRAVGGVFDAIDNTLFLV